MENTGLNSQKLDNANSQRRELKRIDWDVATRILKTMHHYGGQKKTTIARITNMGYDNCILYLDWLDLLGFVKNEAYDYSQIVCLTELGIIFCKTKLMKGSSEVLSQEI